MKRGTVSLFLIVAGVVLIIGAILGSTFFLASPDPNAGGIFGIGGVVVGIVLLVAGMLLRRTQRR